MLHIVYGGSASGKSSYAESFALSLQGDGRLLYIATMYPYKWNTKEIDPETMQRIERHRAMRADKGFDTVECYRHVEHIVAKRQDVLLLECMSNLVANEMFADGKITDKKAVVKKIIAGMEKLKESVAHLVIVSNNVFEDGIVYDQTTMDYIEAIGQINGQLARMADEVVEVVVGIPVINSR